MEVMVKDAGVIAMKAYETSTTVQDHGQIRVAGVRFAPGTEVDVTISPNRRAEDESKS